MKHNKILDYIHIISIPAIIILFLILICIYNYLTGKIVIYISNLYELCGIEIFICLLFMINNIKDYKNGKL